MSILLTYWEDPRHKNTEDDFDEILTVRVKSVKQVPALVAAKPAKCTMVSTEHSGDRKGRKGRVNPLNPRCFIERWRKGQPINMLLQNCPLCGAPAKPQASGEGELA